MTRPLQKQPTSYCLHELPQVNPISRFLCGSGPLPESWFSLQPPLVQAIFSRDVEEVRSLLSQKENINVLVSWEQRGWRAGIRAPVFGTPPHKWGGSVSPLMKLQLFLSRNGSLLHI